ncbi:MAG: hypothetical protein IPK07_13385 [Deltaproteobacteria bacterium]|nr:hypothetical protein [Deltaproteobacteria bacterium]
MARETWLRAARTAVVMTVLAALGIGADCHLIAPTNHDITVGPGFSDVGPHQVVRTSAGLLYTVTATCKFFPTCGSTNTILVHKADQIGTPTAFTAVGNSADVGVQIGAVAIAIDGQDRIHALWTQRDGFVRYGIFDTATDSWGSIEAVDSTNWTDFSQGDQGVALALDANATPYAAWSYRPAQGSPLALRTRFARRLQGGWENPIDVADVVDCEPATADCGAWHPTIAFRPNGDLFLAWETSSFHYERDGWIRTRMRTAAGNWLPSARIEEHSLGGLDDGPAMIVTGDGVAHITFVNFDYIARYYYHDGLGWKGDRQPSPMATHDPGIGPDGAGGVKIYAHGPPPPSDPAGEGVDIFSIHRPRGGAWDESWTLYVAGHYDSSISTRWSQFFHAEPWNLDLVYWTHDSPNELHLGVN